MDQVLNDRGSVLLGQFIGNVTLPTVFHRHGDRAIGNRECFAEACLQARPQQAERFIEGVTL
ncbi:hypothetical protein D3C81_2070410 [compost metagenome]